ncbi:MAG: hypothetical protein WDO15_12185 [Bacteroidota bacterium]
MKKLFLLASLCVSAGSFAQGTQAPPSGSEIILFDLKIKKDKVTLSNPKNITNHPGYDNQPSFHPDLPFITSLRLTMNSVPTSNGIARKMEAPCPSPGQVSASSHQQ